VVARRAWIVCLGLKRYRYERAHPEAALPVAGLPVDEAVRIANSCLNPMGFVEDLRRPAVDGGPSP
jgi:hypothetical protein